MRPSFAHRRNSAFVRSSSLGEVHAEPVIQEVTVRRGNGAKRTIVKNGTIYEQKFGYRKYDKITFEATMIGAGYFFATVMHEGAERLIFVTLADSKVVYTIEQQIPLIGLNFHIAPKVPSNLDPSWLDDASSFLLRKNPAAYTALGFIPTEPVVQRDPSYYTVAQSSPFMSKEMKDELKEQEKNLVPMDDDMWHGHIKNHKWSYGRSGSDVTRGESVRLWQNYDAGWLGASAVYRYMEGKGWECVQQNIANLQVGQPHCIVGQMYGYRDTWGYGGEYWQYRNTGGDMLWGSKADYFGGRNIRLMEQGGRNHLAGKGRNFGKNVHKIQSKGGQHKQNYEGSYHWNRGDEMDSFCAKVEWWNPKTNSWSEPRLYPDYSAPISKRGRFAFYFRFPRQLTEEDEFYEKTPQWKIDTTWDCYPRLDSNRDSPTFHQPIYSRIGRPNVEGTKSGIEIEKNGKKLRTSKESPPYCVMICPEATSDDGNPDYQKDRFICTSGAVVYAAVDPFAYSYADNPDITNAYWVGGNFKPGGSFMLLGKAVDFFPGYWVSNESLSTKYKTPMDLNNEQRDLTRGSHQPNEFVADKIKHSGIKAFKLTDIDNPSKVANFQASWDSCFPGVPLTKEILVAILRGDQLPDLDEIENTQITGFLEDDPLKYEVDYNGVKYRHSYSMVFCKIPEGWWGPTITADTPIESVFIGGQNHYYYIKEEKVNLAAEIEAQKAKEAAGATAAEAFADSELEEPMVDITFEAYKNRNDVISENINAEAEPEGSWFFRKEVIPAGSFKHKKFSLLGSVGTVTDVTEKYSADHVTSLDGLSKKNTQQYGFNDLFVVEGLGNSPSIVLTPPKEPESGVPVKHSNVSGFGNIERHALKSRALGHGNPMTYSTEQKLGSLQPMQVAPMGSIKDTLGEEIFDPLVSTVKTAFYITAGVAAGYALLRLYPTLKDISTSSENAKASKIRRQREELGLINDLAKTKTSTA